MARLGPPTVLVLEGRSPGLVGRVAALLDRDSYLVYPVSQQALAVEPWQAAELLMLGEQLQQPGLDIVASYLENGGKVFDLSTNSDLKKPETLSYFQASALEIDNVETLVSGLEHLRVEVVQEAEEEPALSPGHLVTAGTAPTEAFLARLPGPETQGRVVLDFDPAAKARPPAPTYIPVVAAACPAFDSAQYTSALTSRHLGRTLVYVPCLASSQDPLTAEVGHGVAVAPGRQLRGAGRGGNAWLSPPGCCMVSVQLVLAADSVLGRRPSLLQHLVALAVVQAVQETTGVTLGIKWPNDIYLGREVKMGGVVVAASSARGRLVMTAGVGLNLDNSRPTAALNRVAGARPVARERLLARQLSLLEELVDRVEAGRWTEVEQLYYSCWLHSGQQVRVSVEAGREEEARVVGIDEHGFLRVEGAGGECFTVHDNGNSFDMMAGLIRPKARR